MAESEKPEVLSLDRILIEEVGQFGKYQLRAVALCAIVAVLAAFSFNLYIFTIAKVNTRCLIPECESNSDAHPDFSPPWLHNAVPSGDSIDHCRRYRGTQGNASHSQECPADLFDRTSLVNCEEYVYETKKSAIYDFKMACDEWRPFLIGTIESISMMISLPCMGIISDRWGRRFSLALAAFTLAAGGLAKSWATSYNVYAVMSFIQFFLGSCSFSCAYILAVEYVGPEYRVKAGVTISSCLALGSILQTFIAMAVPYWSRLLLVLHIPGMVFIAYFWVGPESIRWLMSKGRYEEAKDILVKAAKMNGSTLSESTLQAFDNAKNAKLEQEEKSGPSLICLVFKHKEILFRCFYTPFWWITALFVYYGLSLSAVGIIGNKYLNYSAVAAVEIPGYWAAMLLMNRIGRKPLITAGFWICGACQIAYIFIEKENYPLSLTFYLIGKLSISAVMTAIYAYTAELYPTRWRASLLTYSSMIGRLGSIIAPLTPALSAVVWQPLPFVLFAALALVAGMLVQLAPETRGAPLPDCMRDAAALGRDRPSRTRLMLKTLLFRRKCYKL